MRQQAPDRDPSWTVLPRRRPPLPPPLPVADRESIEDAINIRLLLAEARAADDDVEDAAGSLLNVLSRVDTARRSARVAAEAALLSAARAQERALREMAALEREAAEDRLRRIKEVERALDGIDVRSDLDEFIECDRRDRPGARTRMGIDDDGGVASALAVLDSHGEERERGFYRGGDGGTGTFEGWGGNRNGDDDNDNGRDDGCGGGRSVASSVAVTRDDVEGMIDTIFGDDPHLLTDEEWEDCQADGEDGEEWTRGTVERRTDSALEFARAVQTLTSALGDRSSSSSSSSSSGHLSAPARRARSLRSGACFTLNSQRSLRIELRSEAQFDGLCRTFDALLSGCDTREAADVASAKMCMMLAATFYVRRKKKKKKEKKEGTGDWGGEDGGPDDGSDDDNGPSSENLTADSRIERVYVKDRLQRHPIWMDEDFW